MFSFAELLESCFTFSGIYPLFYLSNCSAKISSLPYVYDAIVFSFFDFILFIFCILFKIAKVKSEDRFFLLLILLFGR